MAEDLKALEDAFAAAIELRGLPLRAFLARLQRSKPDLATALERLLRSDALDDAPLLEPVDAALAHWSKARVRNTNLTNLRNKQDE